MNDILPNNKSTQSIKNAAPNHWNGIYILRINLFLLHTGNTLF